MRLLFYFNPRTREGCDVDYGLAYFGETHISIHAPARGATIGRDVQLVLRVLISIHAPARGATEVDMDDERVLDISIHAPARGATCIPVDVKTL